ncbi:hypothetical protein J6A31_05840 [bacterium]|nr:hypothetical protein [bacterium]
MRLGKRVKAFLMALAMTGNICLSNIVTTNLTDVDVLAATGGVVVSCDVQLKTEDNGMVFHAVSDYPCTHNYSYHSSSCGHSDTGVDPSTLTCNMTTSPTVLSITGGGYCSTCATIVNTSVTHTISKYCSICRKSGVSGQNYYYCSTHRTYSPSSSPCGSKSGCNVSGPTYGHMTTGQVTTVDYFYNEDYGYKGDETPITVYPLSVSSNDGITTDVSVTGDLGVARVTDKAYPSHEVTLTFDNVPSGCKVKVTVNGSETVLNAGTATHTFNMPEGITDVTVELATIDPTNNYPTSITKTYGDAASSVGFTTNSDGAVTYTSSNSQVVSVDANGKLTYKKAGSAVITIKTAETANYFASTSTVNVKVDKRAITVTVNNKSRVYKAANPTFDFSITSGSLVGSDTNASLGVILDCSATTNSNVGSYAITGTYSSANYTVIIEPGELTITQATPTVVTAPSASGITYGQTLADSDISGAMNVSGTFEWTNKSTKPSVADSDVTAYPITFTPSDTTNYKTVTDLSATLSVAKAIPTVVTPIKASGITYGQTLADSNILGAMNVPGNFSWVDDSIQPSVSDSNVTPYSIVFTPNDTVNYESVTTLSSKLTVIKADPTDVQIGVPSASDITYGQTLADSVLEQSNSATLPGDFTWQNPSIMPEVNDSNNTAFDVTFTPDDTANYNPRNDIEVMVTVHKATPTVTGTLSASDITYGDRLDVSVLDASNMITSVSGSFVWKTPDYKPNATVGSSFDVVFVPDDTDNYNTVELTCDVVVHKADIVMPNDIDANLSASDIIYGDTLAQSTLTCTTTIPVLGEFKWADSSVMPSVSDSGVTPYDVVYVPTDIDNYNIYEGLTATVIVHKKQYATGEFSNLTATDITYGQSLSDSNISGMAPIDGTFVWDDPDHKPNATVGAAFDVTFIPDDEDNYERVTGLSTIVVVNKAQYTPSDEEIAALTSTSITYGDLLMASTLSSSIAPLVLGQYQWVDGTIKPEVRDSLTTAYDVMFVPDDVTNYDTTYGFTSTVEVNPANYIPSSDELATVSVTGIVYEQTLADSVITGVFVEPGVFEWVDPTIMPTVLDSDSTLYDIRFTANSGNYEPYIIRKTVHVDPKTFTQSDFVGLSASAIYYGQILGKSKITCEYIVGSSCEGQFVWQDITIEPTTADSKVTPYKFDFIPDDQVNYSIVKDMELTVAVVGAQPVITPDVINNLSSTPITYGEALSASVVSSTHLPVSPFDPNKTVPGHWEWVDGSNIYPTVADSERTEYDVIFIPDDSDNYSSIVGLKLTVKVNKADYVMSDDELLSIKSTPITYGQTLANSVINSEINIDGYFGWVNPDIIPEVSDSEVTLYDVYFISENPNYNNIEGLKLTVKVNPRPAGLDFIVTTSAINVGQTLADSTITPDKAIDGTLAWVDPTIAPTYADSDSTEYEIIYTPNNTNLAPTIFGHTVTVNKNDVVWDIPPYWEITPEGEYVIKKTYGDPDFELGIGIAEVPDAVFTYEDEGTDVVSVNDTGVVHIENSGNETVLVKFAGNDTWSSATITVRIIVDKKVPDIPAIVEDNISTSDIDYGQSLGESVITVTGESYNGHFEWKDATIVPEVKDSDVTEYDLVFYPDDDRNYTNFDGFKAKVTVVRSQVNIVGEIPETFDKNETFDFASWVVELVSADISSHEADEDIKTFDLRSRGATNAVSRAAGILKFEDIKFTIANEKVCCIEGHTLKALQAGKTTITASVPSTDNYEGVEKTFSVTVKGGGSSGPSYPSYPVGPSRTCAITSYKVLGIEAKIDQTLATINLDIPASKADMLQNVVPDEIKYVGKWVTPGAQAAVNLEDGFEYTVTADNTRYSKRYTVRINWLDDRGTTCGIMEFNACGAIGTINHETNEIILEVDDSHKGEYTNTTPDKVLWYGQMLTPDKDMTVNFETGVTYRVYAENPDFFKDYTVRIEWVESDETVETDESDETDESEDTDDIDETDESEENAETEEPPVTDESDESDETEDIDEPVDTDEPDDTPDDTNNSDETEDVDDPIDTEPTDDTSDETGEVIDNPYTGAMGNSASILIIIALAAFIVMAMLACFKIVLSDET